jgi:aminoglycoside phosphotransferase (APT) family kinase protein
MAGAEAARRQSGPIVPTDDAAAVALSNTLRVCNRTGEPPMDEQFAGTMPVQERYRIDSRRLAAYLRAHLPDCGDSVELEQFKGGQSNPTFLLRCGGRRYVLRRKPAGKLLPSAHAIEREYRVITALHRCGVPVARGYCLCEDDSIIGTAFYVMEYVEGRIFWEQSLPDMSGAQRGAIYAEMNRVIAQLHSVDYAAAGLADYGRPGNYFARQIARWTQQYRASETATIAAMENLIAWLPQHIPPGDETAVVHGDYRLDNLIFHPTRPQILAVLDWELSTIGHPLADFSYHCLSWHIPPTQARGICGLDLPALGIPFEQDYIAAYCRRTGRAPIDAGHWNFYLAYNLFRVAAILQGVMKRALDGTASSQQAHQTGAKARALAELGWQRVTGA